MFVRLALVLLVLFLFCEAVEAGYVPPNNFTNGDFQAGSFSAWSLSSANASSGAQVVSDGSNYYAEVYAMSELDWIEVGPGEFVEVELSGNACIYQEIDVPLSATELAFDYRGQAEYGPILVSIIIPDEYFYSYHNLEQSNDWITGYSITLPTEVKGQTTRFEFGVETDPIDPEIDSAVLELDNIAIVPEPATFLLLIVGYLTLRKKQNLI